MKNEALVLSTAEPINDGGRRWNFIYYVSVIAILLIFISMGANFTGWIFAIALGCVVGWLIKNKVAEIHAQMLRNTKFAVQNKVEYSQLIHELIPRLTPLGALIEKSSNENGCPIISYQDALYDITYNEDNTFCVWWRQNLARAFFSADYIKIYRKEVVAMGIIAYHIQQICALPNDESIKQNVKDNVCKVCGSEIESGAKFCVHCGTRLE